MKSPLLFPIYWQAYTLKNDKESEIEYAVSNEKIIRYSEMLGTVNQKKFDIKLTQ